MAGSEKRAVQRRYGIGEWYGRPFAPMSASERRELAEPQYQKDHKPLCPWRTRDGAEFACNKAGGVCSLRQYELDPLAGRIAAAGGANAGFCTTCPNRFYESDTIFRWIGEKVLGNTNPVVLAEIPFLERERSGKSELSGREDVGKIDHVLVHTDADRLLWCALEMQAVYFSGFSMSREFKALREGREEGIPFPIAVRRPDYRSSGPKRLMPQLQVKVPALRRWGKRMAVVVDRAFFEALGHMDDVPDLSNSDIAWFVVEYQERDGSPMLVPAFARFTTLERAVEGLTAGRPVSQEEFEKRIRSRIRPEASQDRG